MATVPLYAEKEQGTDLYRKPANWLDAKNLIKTVSSEAELAERQVMLTRIKREPFWKFIPRDLQDAIEKSTVYRVDEGSDPSYHFLWNEKIHVVFEPRFSCYTILPQALHLIQPLEAPERTQAVNPKTGKYYVMPPKKTLVSLSETDSAYVQEVTAQINRNIHYLGNSPVPKFDMKAFKKGKYMLSAIFPLTIHPGEYVFSDKFMKYHKMNEAELRHFFGLEDDIAYDIAKRIGIPVYHPEQFPGHFIKVRSDCQHTPIHIWASNPEIINPLFLGWSGYETDDRTLPNLYRQYFQVLEDSISVFRDGLRAEKAAHSPTDARYPAIEALTQQADAMAAALERSAQKYKANNQIYKKPPRSLLDPSGTHLNKFLNRQKQLMEKNVPEKGKNGA